MIQDLSNHLRYTLSSGQSVSLAEELRLVQNYVDLSQVIHMEIEEEDDLPEEQF